MSGAFLGASTKWLFRSIDRTVCAAVGDGDVVKTRSGFLRYDGGTRQSADSAMSTRLSATATWTLAKLFSVRTSSICEKASAVTVIT
jgi:hypothetical protein